MNEKNAKVTMTKTTVMDVPNDEFKETTLDIISSMKESGSNITELTITGGDQKGTMKIIVKEEI